VVVTKWDATGAPVVSEGGGRDPDVDPFAVDPLVSAYPVLEDAKGLECRGCADGRPAVVFGDLDIVVSPLGVRASAVDGSPPHAV